MKDKILEKISRYQFVAMIALAVLIAMVSTIASIWVYTSSGAINLDLSRPGYEDIREETYATEPKTQFQSSGPIDKNAIEDFNSRIEDLQNEINSMNNFSGDVMSDEALGIAESK
jgi:hypothetical protein